MLKGLSGLDGHKSSESVDYKAGTGDFKAAFDAKKAVTFDAIKKAAGFTLEKMRITVAGEPSRDDKGLWLKAASTYALANRDKKKDEEKAPDVVAKVDELLKAGEKAIRVTGTLTADDKGNHTIRLDSAEAVKKSPEKK